MGQAATLDGDGEAFRAALDGSACLGAWSYDTETGLMTLPVAFVRFVGVLPEEAAAGIAVDRMLAGIGVDDRLRVESVLYAACEASGPFEAEFRTRSEPHGIRWIRLMGRSEQIVGSGVRARGLIFDLTEGRLHAGSPKQRIQRQVNQLADHVTAMQSLVGALHNPPLTQLVERIAVEIGYELARRLQATEGGRRH